MCIFKTACWGLCILIPTDFYWACLVIRLNNTGPQRINKLFMERIGCSLLNSQHLNTAQGGSVRCEDFENCNTIKVQYNTAGDQTGVLLSQTTRSLRVFERKT